MLMRDENVTRLYATQRSKNTNGIPAEVIHNTIRDKGICRSSRGILRSVRSPYAYYKVAYYPTLIWLVSPSGTAHGWPPHRHYGTRYYYPSIIDCYVMHATVFIWMQCTSDTKHRLQYSRIVAFRLWSPEMHKRQKGPILSLFLS